MVIRVEASGLGPADQDGRHDPERKGYDLIRTLPAPKQEVIKEALTEEATKEDLQKVIRELAAADQREIEVLTKERDDAVAIA